MSRAFLLLGTLLTLALTGCDVLGSTDPTVRASGRVVDAETGAPLAGIFVFIYDQSPIVVPLDEAFTGPDGRFALEHDDGPRPQSFIVKINDHPDYDDRYGSDLAVVQRGQTVNLGDIPLRRTGATPP